MLGGRRSVHFLVASALRGRVSEFEPKTLRAEQLTLATGTVAPRRCAPTERRYKMFDG